MTDLQSNISDLAVRLQQSFNGNSIKEVSHQTGIAISTIRSYLNGTEPKITTLVTLARYFEVDLQWLATGEPSITGVPGYISHSSERVVVPYLNLDLFSVSQIAWHKMKSEMVIQTRLLKIWMEHEIGVLPPNGMRWVYVESDAMGSELRKGNLVLIALCSPLESCPEGIYVLRMGGGIVFRRLQPDSLSRHLVLVPDNPAYKETHVSLAKVQYGEVLDNDKVVIVGKVIFVFHRI